MMEEIIFHESFKNQMSLRFFLITIIFLIFDVEIVILIPYLKAFNESAVSIWWPTTIIFIIVLILGLIHEWNQGALKWSLWRYSQPWHLNCIQIVFFKLSSRSEVIITSSFGLDIDLFWSWSLLLSFYSLNSKA